MPPPEGNPSTGRRPVGGHYHDEDDNPVNLEPTRESVANEVDRRLPEPVPRPPPLSRLAQVKARGLTKWNPQYEVNTMEYEHLANTRTAQLVARHKESGAFDLIRQRAHAEAEANRKNPPPQHHRLELAIKALIRDWATLSREEEPDLTDKELWESWWVNHFATTFIAMRVHMVHGRNGGMVRAVTVFNWSTILIKGIIRYSRDANGNPDGTAVLIQQRLHASIRAMVTNVIITNNLCRFQNKKIYYGRWELLLMLSWLLKSSENGAGNERLVKMQLACLLMLCYYILSRPGSLAPFNEDMLKRGLLLTLGDIKLHLIRGLWGCQLSVTVKAWKGQYLIHNATAREFLLDSVTMSHNVIVDPTVWFITYMLYRGAFGPQYKTLEDLETCELATLEVVHEKRDEPFFLAATQGGHDLVPGKAATPVALSHAVTNAAVGAGLPPASMYAFRRDGGNDYATKVGVIMAQSTMGHRNPGAGDNNRTKSNTFDQYYAVGVAQMAFVPVRNGEIQSRTDEVTMAELRQRNFLKPALDALVNLKFGPQLQPTQVVAQAPADREVTSGAATEEQLEEIANMFSANTTLPFAYQLEVVTYKRMFDAREEVKTEWKNFLGCFPSAATGYQHANSRSTANIERILENYPRRMTSPKITDEHTADLRAAILVANNTRKNVVRRARDALKAGITLAQLDIRRQKATLPVDTAVHPSGPTLPAFGSSRAHNTYKNRENAQVVLDNEGQRIITEAVQGQLRASTSAPSRPAGHLAAAAARVANSSSDMPAETPAQASAAAEAANDQVAEGVAAGRAAVGREGGGEPQLPHLAAPVDPNSLVAPWDQPTDAQAWDDWRNNLISAGEDIAGRAGNYEEEYAFANDLTVADDLLLIESYMPKAPGEVPPSAPQGGPSAILHRLMDEAGVPHLSDRSSKAVPDLAATDTTTNVAVEESVHQPGSEDPSVPAVDEEVPDVGDPSATEVDVIGLPCPILRAFLARYIIDPLLRQAVIDAFFKANGNKWICPKCVEFTHSDDRDRVYPSRAVLEHHMRIHTPWHDLELDLIQEDGTWKCPSCGVIKRSQKSLRPHLVRHCPNKEQYQAMQVAHQEVTIHHNRNRRPKNLEIKEDERIHQADDTSKQVSNALREGVLNIRNWDITKMINERIESGKLPEHARAAKLAAFRVLRELSECAWESEEFYFVPISRL